MLKLSKEKEGELSILAEAFLWGVFPVFTVMLISDLEPIFTAGISTLIAGIFLGLILIKQKLLHELLNTKAYLSILGATVILAIIYYAVYYYALQLTTANNASIIGLTQQFFAMIYFGLLIKHEKVTRKLVFGGILVFIGAVTITVKPGFQFNHGDLLILAVTAIAPFGSLFMQKARKHVSSYTIIFYRSIIGGLFLLLLSFLLESPSLSSLNAESVMIIIVSGILLLGYSKILWIEGIHRITISKAYSIGSSVPIFTMLFSYILLNEPPTPKQIAALVPILIGYHLIIQKDKISTIKQKV